VVTLLVIVVSLGVQLIMVVRGIDVLVPEEGQAAPGVLTRMLRLDALIGIDRRPRCTRMSW
jgi:hypothetical protein